MTDWPVDAGDLTRTASMRPRGLPADDAGGEEGLEARVQASMRPRGLPADDVARLRPVVCRLLPVASMRPRGLPADDLQLDGAERQLQLSFNEAAGTTRG